MSRPFETDCSKSYDKPMTTFKEVLKVVKLNDKALVAQYIDWGAAEGDTKFETGTAIWFFAG
ncbi:MAG: hypothetical protein WAN11_18955 [Syntrophobacteraceae bacterium]